jgi:hypothetical protein
MSETSASASEPPSDDGDSSGSSDPSEQRAALRLPLLEQMGGISGLIYSGIPIVVFVLVNALTSLTPAIWVAIGVAVLIGVVRLVRREPLQPAISGVFVVAVCAFIAYRSGEAKGFFLLGIWTSLIYGGVFLISVLVRWPLVGAAWSLLKGQGFEWRGNRRALVAYDLATLTWVVVFGAKFVVQHWLYVENQTGWLAFARIVMSYPLTALALLVTVWAVRRASAAASGDVASTAHSASSATS